MNVVQFGYNVFADSKVLYTMKYSKSSLKSGSRVDLIFAVGAVLVILTSNLSLYHLPNVLRVIDRPICQNTNAITLCVQKAELASVIVENNEGRNTRPTTMLIPNIFDFPSYLNSFNINFFTLATFYGSNRTFDVTRQFPRSSTESLDVNIWPNTVLSFQGVG
mmetsp:Transcript_25225/g.59071  ORF Transcript_25225/g.59071 Transcript_25225/m.59071 type:complete len:163 (+) Transcript_25225:132-620(+)